MRKKEQGDQIMDEMKKWLREKVKKEEIPDSLRPEHMEKKLEGVRQRGGGFPAHRAGILIAAALLFAVLGVGGSFLFRSGGESGNQNASRIEVAGENGSGEKMVVPTGEDAKAFESDISYEELYSLVQEAYSDEHIVMKPRVEQKALTDGAAIDFAENAVNDGTAYMKNDARGEDVNSESLGEEDHSKTDLQVAGVQEGDRILTDGRYIYTVHDKEEDGMIVHILKADGDRTKEISRMDISSCCYAEMYLYQDQLFLIGSKEITEWKHEKAKGYASVEDVLYRREVVTKIYVIDVSDKEQPKQKYMLKQDGYYKNSRLTDGFLYLFSGYEVPYFRSTDLKKEKPETYVPKVNGDPVPEDRIYAPSKKSDASYTVMTSLKLEEASDFYDKAAIYGTFRDFYMGQENFYITQKKYEPMYYVLKKEVTVDETEEALKEEEGSEEKAAEAEKDMDTKDGQEDAGKTILLKYAYENGRFSMQAKGSFEGETVGSYAFHEYQGNLSIIYTKYEEETTNGLYVFDPSLKKIGEIGNLGVEEEIYASYYIENMAYFVTYRNTDPVFAVDIADPRRPKLCSELKLPGYSDYLHSFGEDHMIGLGFHGDGKNSLKDRVKISLFRIDEKKSLTEVSKEVTEFKSEDYELGDKDHRQVFVDEERGLLGFYVWKYGNLNEYQYLLYKKSGDKFVQIWNTTMQLQDIGYSYDCLRGIRIGESFYVVSVSGEVKTFLL